jgi:ribosomal protein L27
MSFTKVELSGLNQNSGSLAFRNRIINGAMEISQRGTSFAAVANVSYTMDRFFWATAGTGVVTITQSTDVPNNTFQNSLRVDVTTADTSIAAGDFYRIVQSIEGYNVRDLIGQTFTLSFWVKSPKTGVHCVSFRNFNNDRSYITEYTVSAANTWEYKTITVNGGLITGGTWDWTNGTGIRVGFELAVGSTFQTTSGSWQVGNFSGTSNQVNCMDNVNNDFFLTGVQLELGPVATPFERRPFGVELALCQRYYFNPTGDNSWISYQFYTATASNTFLAAGHYTYPVPMRVTPTLSLNTTSATFTNCSNLTLNSVSSPGTNENVYGFIARVTSTAAGIYRCVGWTWDASAEL